MSTSPDGAHGSQPLISRAARLQRIERAVKEESRFRRRILASAGFITFNAVVATIANQIVEGWSLLDSLYMVAITLTTVGFGEAYPLSLAGRILALGLVVFGVGGAIYALSAIAEYVAKGHFAAGIRRRRLHRMISKLSGHYIVCEFGRIGRGVASELLRDVTSPVSSRSTPRVARPPKPWDYPSHRATLTKTPACSRPNPPATAGLD